MTTKLRATYKITIDNIVSYQKIIEHMHAEKPLSEQSIRSAEVIKSSYRDMKQIMWQLTTNYIN